MTTAYTSLLGLALPVTGELSGTWGTTVNDAITSLLDSAVAGTTTLSSDADVTLTTTNGAANTSREAILLWTAGGTVTRNITAPAQSKTYIVINKSSSTQSIVLRGVGPTTGVTIIKGESAVCAWNGSDFIKVSNISGAGVFSSITNTGLTSGRVVYSTTGGLETDSANLLFDGTTLTASSITSKAATALTLQSAGTTAVTVDTSQNVGIGTSSPSSKLHVVSSSGENKIISEATAASQQASISLIVQAATPGQTVIYMGKTGATTNGQLGYDPNTNAMTLYTNNSERMRIDSGGNVGIGTSAPNRKLEVSDSSDTQIRFTGTNTANGASLVGYSNSDAVSFGVGGSTGGRFGATLSYIGSLTNVAFLFMTNSVERMRIDSSGNLLVNTTTANYSATQGFGVAAGTGTYAFVSHASGTASSTDYIAFSYAGTRIGNITQNGTTGVLYNLTSDYRLKDNPVALTGAKDFVMALQPKTWDWWDGSGKGVGFIAHEFMEVAKYSGFGEKDAVDADNKPIHQAIQPSSSEVMANLVAFVQEQQALITSLTARIVALEST